MVLSASPLIPGTSYLWSTGSTSNSISAQPNQSGNYSVIVSDGVCMTDTLFFSVVVNPLPIVDAGADTTISYGSSAQLHGTGGIFFVWTPSSSLTNPNSANPLASPITATEYVLTVTDANGCIGSDTVDVNVSCQIFVPNAFSPNGDGNNDTFRVYGACINKLHLEIYDRWGTKVFETNDPAEGWDGTYDGKEMESAVFTYVLTGLLRNSAPVEKQGNITLTK